MGSADRIELSGLTFTALVGVLPEERTRTQPLRADVTVEVDLSAAGVSDELSDTVDYGSICDEVVAVGTAGHPQLLERLATMIADAVLASDERISAVELRLVKLRPPVAHQLETAGVRITRRSGSERAGSVGGGG